jgi:hypothetical protein
MNKFARRSSMAGLAVSAASAALLAGCGGGDAGGSPPAQLITTKEQVLAVFNAVGIGPSSVDFEGTAVTLVDNALFSFASSTSPVVQNCFGPTGAVSGNIRLSLGDADNSGAASAGDTVTMQLNACFFEGATSTATASFRLNTVNNLSAYYGGSGTGGYSGVFSFGTVPVTGYTIAGDFTIAQAYEIRSGLRTRVSSDSSPQLVFTGPAGTFNITSIFGESTSDVNVNTTTRYERTATANVPTAGNLSFTSSVVEAVRFPEDGGGAPSGVLLLRNQGVDIRLTINATGFSAAVDNGRDGSVEHTFNFTFGELDS